MEFAVNRFDPEANDSYLGFEGRSFLFSGKLLDIEDLCAGTVLLKKNAQQIGKVEG